MKISFKGVNLLKYPNRKLRDKVKELEETSNNGNGDFWTSVKIDSNQGSSDLLLVYGFDLEEAKDNSEGKMSVEDYLKANAQHYIKKAKVYDYID